MTTTPFACAPSFTAGSFPFGAAPTWGGVSSPFASIPAPFGVSPFVSPVQSWTRPFGWTSPFGYTPWSVSGAAGMPFSAPFGWATAGSTVPGVTPWNFSGPIGATPWTTPATPWSAVTPWTTPWGFAAQGFGGFGQIPFGQIPFGQTPWTAPFGASQWSGFSPVSGFSPISGFSPVSPVGQYVPFVTPGFGPARNGYTSNGHVGHTNGVASTISGGHVTPGFAPAFGQFVGQPFAQVSFGGFPFSQVPFSATVAGCSSPFGYSPFGASTVTPSSSPFIGHGTFGYTPFGGYTPGYTQFGYTPVSFGGSAWPTSPYTPVHGFGGGQGFSVPASYPYPQTDGEIPVGVSQRDAA